jgi:hypothetical protein
MESEWLDIFTHLLVATMAGGLIGLERIYHGRPGRLMGKGGQLEYRMTMRTMDSGNIEKLSKTLLGSPSIVEFNISMAGD